MVIKKPEVVAWRWRKPVVNDQGEAVGETAWVLSDAPEFLSWWTNEPLIRLSDYERLQAECEKLRAEYEEETFCLRQDRDTHFGELMRALEQVEKLQAESLEMAQVLAECRSNDRQAMSYLNQIREIVGGDDFPDMVQRCKQLRKDAEFGRSVLAKTEPGKAYGCHCDLDDGMEPDGCVIDSGERHNCIYAKNISVKEQCEYWRVIASDAHCKQGGGGLENYTREPVHRNSVSDRPELVAVALAVCDAVDGGLPLFSAECAVPPDIQQLFQWPAQTGGAEDAGQVDQPGEAAGGVISGPLKVSELCSRWAFLFSDC